MNTNNGIRIISKNDDEYEEFKGYVQKTGHKLCFSEDGSFIQENFFKRAIDAADYIFVVARMIPKTNTTFEYNFEQVDGFALINEQPNNTLYLNLICGAGTGSRIFQLLEKFARSLKKTKIVLSAVPAAMILYYKKYGFKFSETCTMNNNINKLANSTSRMNAETRSRIKEIYKRISDLKSRANKTAKRTEKRPILGEISSLETEKMLLTKSMSTSLNQLKKKLISKGVVSKKGCKTPKNCNSDGYTMIKCLK